MSQSYVNKSTTSDGKIMTEFFSDELIRPILKRLHSKGSYKIAVLVGCVEGLTRHLTRYLAMGVPMRDIVIFEYDYATYISLRDAVKRRGLKCQVIYGDLLHGVVDMAQNGTKWSFIEFDGVCQFGAFEFDLFEIVKQFNIPILVSQGSSRGQTKEVKGIAKSLKLKRRLVSGYKCFELIQVASRIISRKLRGYKTDFFTYQGVSNMYMQVSIQKRLS